MALCALLTKYLALRMNDLKPQYSGVLSNIEGTDNTLRTKWTETVSYLSPSLDTKAEMPHTPSQGLAVGWVSYRLFIYYVEPQSSHLKGKENKSHLWIIPWFWVGFGWPCASIRDKGGSPAPVVKLRPTQMWVGRLSGKGPKHCESRTHKPCKIK
jgi:hypothetical protein